MPRAKQRPLDPLDHFSEHLHQRAQFLSGFGTSGLLPAGRIVSQPLHLERESPQLLARIFVEDHAGRAGRVPRRILGR